MRITSHTSLLFSTRYRFIAARLASCESPTMCRLGFVINPALRPANAYTPLPAVGSFRLAMCGSHIVLVKPPPVSSVVGVATAQGMNSFPHAATNSNKYHVSNSDPSNVRFVGEQRHCGHLFVGGALRMAYSPPNFTCTDAIAV